VQDLFELNLHKIRPLNGKKISVLFEYGGVINEKGHWLWKGFDIRAIKKSECAKAAN
jgi:hypothetical protein